MWLTARSFPNRLQIYCLSISKPSKTCSPSLGLPAFTAWIFFNLSITNLKESGLWMPGLLQNFLSGWCRDEAALVISTHSINNLSFSGKWLKVCFDEWWIFRPAARRKRCQAPSQLQHGEVPCSLWSPWGFTTSALFVLGFFSLLTVI